MVGEPLSKLLTDPSSIGPRFLSVDLSGFLPESYAWAILALLIDAA